MLTDDEMLNLPDDPELAFVEFERITRQKLDGKLASALETEMDSTSVRVDYMSAVLAAARHFELDILTGWDLPKVPSSSSYHHFYDEFQQFLSDVNHVTVKIQLKHARRTCLYSVAFDPKTKAIIRHHLTQIKEIVDKLDVPEKKRNALYRKISALENEVDRDRTRFDAFMALFLESSNATGKAAENLKPLTDRIREISDIFGKAKAEEDEHTPALPSPDERKRNEPPRRLPPARTGTLDDEIPF